MNFSEALKELDSLNEELLMEKKWVAILPKKLEGQAETDNVYYKFLTVDDPAKQKADVLQMLDTHIGTYKQMLHKEHLAELRKKIKAVQDARKKGLLSDTEDFDIIRGKAVDQLQDTQVKVLTLSDRYLRNKAQQEIRSRLPKALQNSGYLIHHINQDEVKNNPENLILVPYQLGNKEDLKVATGIHSILHLIANSQNLQIGLNKFDGIKIYRLDSNFEVKTGECTITIEIPQI